APDLPHRFELLALTDTAPANAPIIGATLPAGKNRRAALATKVLKPRPAIVARLGVDFQSLSRHPDLFACADHGDAVGRAGELLAVGTVTDGDRLRIDLGLIGHASAMALADYFHRSLRDHLR